MGDEKTGVPSPKIHQCIACFCSNPGCCPWPFTTCWTCSDVSTPRRKQWGWWTIPDQSGNQAGGGCLGGNRSGRCGPNVSPTDGFILGASKKFIQIANLMGKLMINQHILGSIFRHPAGKTGRFPAADSSQSG